MRDVAQAEAWFIAHGCDFDESSRVLNPDGSTKLVYFAREIGGFALHLTHYELPHI